MAVKEAAPVPSLQPTFTGGELSPSLYARVDLQRYGTSVKKGKNFIVRPYGGLVNRPGFGYVSEAKDSTKKTRLIPFVYSTEIAYVIELGDQYARFIYRGGYILAEALDGAYSAGTSYSEGDLVSDGGIIYRSLQDTNLAHTPASSPLWWLPNPLAEVATPWTEDQIFDVSHTQSADVMYFAHQAYQPVEIRRYTANTFTSTYFDNKNGPFTTINADESIKVQANSELGAVTLTASSDIFTADHVGTLFYLEEKDLRGQHPWEAGWRGVSIGTLCRSDGKVYRASDVAATGSGAGGFMQTGSVRPTHDSGRAWDGPNDVRSTGSTNYGVGVEWEYLHSGFGVVLLTGYTDAKHMTGEVTLRIPASCVNGTGLPINTWTLSGNNILKTFTIGGALSDSESDYTVTIDGASVQSDPHYLPPKGLGGGALPGSGPLYDFFNSFVSPLFRPRQGWTVNSGADTITFLSAPSNNSNNIVVKEFAGTDTGQTDVWAFGAWSEVQGYPAEVEFFSERLIFAGTTKEPQSEWMSKTGDYLNFGRSNPVVDDDTITVTLNARQQNAIRELVPLDKLITMTTGGEWKTGDKDDVLTPATVAFKPQSYNGSSKVPALVIGNAAIYVQNRGYVVRDIAYQFEVDGYTGSDLTVFSSHLTEGKPIAGWAFQQTPFSCAWVVRADGVLLALTYMREQQVVGWTPMEVDGLVESVCVVPEETEDVLYAVIQRTIGGTQKRYIERMATRLITDIREARFLDSFLTFDGRANGTDTMTATGASWLVGDTVTLTADQNQFEAGDIDDIIVLGYQEGRNTRLRINAYTSPTIVTAEIETPIAADLQAVPVTDWGFARTELTGFEHIAGETVGVLGDGFVQDEREVSVGGVVTLDEPAVMAHVGLPYESDFETLEVNFAGAQTLRLNNKLIKRLGLIVQDSRSIFAGPDFDHLDEFEPRDVDTNPVGPPSLLQETVEMYITADWSKRGRVCVRQSDPLPLSLLGIVTEVEVGQ